MSYIYKIYQHGKLKYVEESSELNITVAQNNIWNVYDLIHKNVDQMSKKVFWTMQLESFKRTKEWLRENHPELLL
jgi:hypothetical protein